MFKADQQLLIAAREATESMKDLLVDWASVNSGSNNEQGLLSMLAKLEEGFAGLPVEVERVPCVGILAEGNADAFQRFALRVRLKSSSGDAKKPILLNGHYDTVYGPGSRFQSVASVSDRRMVGPGVTDMKGGLVVLLTALKIWESSPYADTVPWEVLITPDEEIGSEASDPLLKDAANRCRFGLVFESSYPDGGFVRKRKGSALYKLSARGRPAHVGRNYEDGRNAILGLSTLCHEVQDLAGRVGVIANVGRFEANSPLNVVPEFAESAWNVRADSPEQFEAFELGLKELVGIEREGALEGIEFTWSRGLMRPAKTADEKTQVVYDAVEKIASGIGLPVLWRDTGGGADGSNLAAYGLPNIDNLGVRGGAIHSEEEFIELDSLSERVGLTLAILQAESEGAFIEEGQL